VRGARGSYNAKGMKAAADKAERAFKPHPQGKQQFIDLTLAQVTFRLELFQPREFCYGERKTSPSHVKKLAKHISIKGQLDPVLVIKLGEEWVCVDGHHRIAGYQKEGWAGTIKCEWFTGTVRQAIAASMSLNNTIHLEVPREDRQERAWKHTILGWGSKREIHLLCGVSDGTISEMRRVKARYDGGDGEDLARKFQEALRAPLDETSWSKAHLTWLGAGPREIDENAQAAKLAKSMRSRMENRLADDATVTARALALYDPDLPAQLYAALRSVIGHGMKPGAAVADDEIGAAMIDTLPVLSADELSKLKQALEAAMVEGQPMAF
jgi:hypothetical protein